jgi:hypothetical protein
MSTRGRRTDTASDVPAVPQQATPASASKRKITGGASSTSRGTRTNKVDEQKDSKDEEEELDEVPVRQRRTPPKKIAKKAVRLVQLGKPRGKSGGGEAPNGSTEADESEPNKEDDESEQSDAAPGEGEEDEKQGNGIDKNDNREKEKQKKLRGPMKAARAPPSTAVRSQIISPRVHSCNSSFPFCSSCPCLCFAWLIILSMQSPSVVTSPLRPVLESAVSMQSELSPHLKEVLASNPRITCSGVFSSLFCSFQCFLSALLFYCWQLLVCATLTLLPH